MNTSDHLGVRAILSQYRGKLALTWCLLAVENFLMALIPLFVGYSIDDLLNGSFQQVWLLAGILILLVAVAVLRRIYDTRVFGDVKIDLSRKVDHRLQEHSVSIRNARLTMSREIVEFLENDIPLLFTAIIQIAVAISILFSFDGALGVAAIVTLLIMLMIYALIHRRFLKLNGLLNTQLEKQVSLLTINKPTEVLRHFRELRKSEVKLSDTEAVIYGLIFLLLFGFVIANLVSATHISVITAGAIFSIVTYSLEFVESAITLPLTLQQLTRVGEITNRLNNLGPTELEAEDVLHEIQ